MLSHYYSDMNRLFLTTCITLFCTFSITHFRPIFNSHKMKIYVKPNIVGGFLDIETCSSIGEDVLQPSPVFLASTSLASHTLVACQSTLVHILVFS